MSEIETNRERIRALVSGPGKSTQWIAAHLDHANGDWCLIWPFAWKEGGYPIGGRRPQFTVHRLMCEYRHGPPPSPKHHSAHECRRGTQGCVNPMHVSWKTPAENQRDRNDACGRRKLTVQEVDEIREIGDRERPIELAKRFGVSLPNIKLILAGKTWRFSNQRHVFTPDEVVAIRNHPGNAPQAAQELGFAVSAVRRIRQRVSYAWVEDSSTLPTPEAEQ
jgi:hypothetical protein